MIRISLLIALGIGLVWLVLVHLMPRIMSVASIVFSIIILLVTGAVVFLDRSSGYQNNGLGRILIGTGLIVAAVLFALELCFYRRRIKLTGIFLDWATKFLV